MAICSFASGSSGNCFLIRTAETTLLVDVGISGKQAAANLASLGLGLSDVDAVLITHEHSDHIKGIKVIAGKSGARLCMSKGTFSGIPCAKELCGVEFFTPGDSFEIGDIRIDSFPLSHDAAEPTGYSFKAFGRQISIVTDTGCVTKECRQQISTADILILESNHDESVLRMGRYPWFLKQRILSDKGHLSNEAAANALLDVLKEEALQQGSVKSRLVLLAHLSQENNFPEMALQTMSNVLDAGGFRTGNRLRVEVLPRTEPSPIFII